MTGDERRRPSVADDIASQSARPVPREFHIGPWIAIAIIIGLLAWIMLR